MDIQIKNYTFDASLKTITFDDYVSIRLDSVRVITNVTDNILIYNFIQIGRGGTVLTNVLTLDYDTTSMDDADDLQIVYNDDEIKATQTDQQALLTELQLKADVTETQPVSAASLPLPTGASTEAKQLADGHNVTANAGTNLNTSALATEATLTADLQSIEDNQTDGTQKTQILNGTGSIDYDNPLNVLNFPYGYAIAEGDVAGHSSLYKFGSNPDIGVGEETIWRQGGLYDWVGVDAAPGIVKLSSSSTDDVNITGTGAWLVTIYGLSTVGVEQSEQLAMTGQAGVNSTLEYSRVNRIIVNTGGTGLKNAGTIYVGTGIISTGVPAVIWSTVDVGKNQTLQSIWTVPTGKTFYMTSFAVSTNSNKGNVINMYFRPPGELFQIKVNAYLFSTNFVKQFDIPLSIASGTDIDCRAIGTATGAGIAMSFEGWYE